MRIGPATASINGTMVIPSRLSRLAGVGYTVNTAVYGMPETTPVQDTASFVADRTAMIKNTAWGWTTPAAYRSAMMDLISNRCSLYTDSCAEIGPSSQWSSYVDRLTADYTAWYDQAIAAFKVANHGLDPAQAAVANAAADQAYTATVNAAVNAGVPEAQAILQGQHASENVFTAQGTPGQSVSQNVLVPPTQAPPVITQQQSQGSSTLSNTPGTVGGNTQSMIGQGSNPLAATSWIEDNWILLAAAGAGLIVLSMIKR